VRKTISLLVSKSRKPARCQKNFVIFQPPEEDLIPLNISGKITGRRAVIVFMLLHIAIFLLIFIPLSQLFYAAPGVMELSFANEMLSGSVPYRDFNSEYPPLALLAFLLPALIRGSNPSYSLFLAGEMMLFDLAIIYFVADIAGHLRLGVKKTLAVYTVIFLAVGPIMAVRFDLMPAALVIAALWAFIKGKNLPAWIFTALGVAGKIYPLIIAPALGLYLLRNRQFKALFTGVAAFALTLMVSCLPFFLMSPGGFIRILTYHGERGIQCESTWASALLLYASAGGPEVEGVFGFGSWNISSALADQLATLAFPLTAMALLAVYVFYFWRLLKQTPRTWYDASGIEADSARFIIGYATLAITLFMVFNKVFSPQFLIWLIPTVSLLSAKWQIVYASLFVGIGLLTQFIFPYKYMEYSSFLTPFVLVLALRNAMLVLLTALIFLNNNLKEEVSLSV
jgi:uncharacterized membrane protein